MKLGNYEWLVTDDQSPSLKLGEAGEWMHSSGGAYSETQYIYGEAIRQTLSMGFGQFFSLGLGLGYNELLIVAEALRKGFKLKDLRIESYEADPFLVDSFLEWQRQKKSGESIKPEYAVYESILSCFKKDYGEKLTENVVVELYSLFQSGQWKIFGPLGAETDFRQNFNCILYDAFSAKSSPELWTEEFLNHFLLQAADEACVFATYACTGALKRSLIKNDFRLHIRKGFHVKKESLYGERL